MPNPVNLLSALSEGANAVATLKNAFNPAGGLSWSDVAKNEALMGAQWRENERVYRMQRGDYLSDLADERRYSSAEAQVERLRAAGLNPALVFGEGNLGSTSKAPVAGSPAPGSPPSPDPTIQVRSEAWNRLAEQIGGAVGSFYDNLLKKEAAREAGARADEQEVNARFSAQEKISQLQKMLDDHHLSSLERQQIQQNIMWLQSTWDDRKRATSLENERLEAQNEVFKQERQLLAAQTAAQNLQTALMPEHLKVDQRQAQAAVMSAGAAIQQAITDKNRFEDGKKLTQANVDYLASLAAKTWIDAYDSGMDASMKKKYLPVVEKYYKSNLEKLAGDAKWQNSFYVRLLHEVEDVAGTAIVTYGLSKFLRKPTAPKTDFSPWSTPSSTFSQ